MLKVLFVEDDLVDQMAFLRMIKKNKLDYKLDIVDSLNLAEEMLSNNHYDLIISDLNFPDGTAFEILKIKESIPIIFISGSNDKSVMEEAINAGADEFLVKDSQLEYLRTLPKLISFLTQGNHKEDKFLGELAPIDEDKLVNASEKELVDLSHLSNVFDNNKKMINEVINVFLDQNPSQLEKLKEAIENNNSNLSNKIAHQIKSGYSMMGMRFQRDLAELIEKTATEKNINFDKLYKMVLQLVESSQKAYPVLSKLL